MYLRLHLSDLPTASQDSSIAPRDYWSSESDAHNIKASVLHADWKRSSNEVDSIASWVASHKDDVLFYQQQVVEQRPDGSRVVRLRLPADAALHARLLTSYCSKEITPFILVLVPFAMLDVAKQLIDGGTVCADGTFGE